MIAEGVDSELPVPRRYFKPLGVSPPAFLSRVRVFFTSRCVHVARPWSRAQRSRSVRLCIYVPQFIGCGLLLRRSLATTPCKGQQTLPLGQLHMSPCLKLLVFLAPQCGSAHRTVAHRRAPSRAPSPWGAGSWGAAELRSWERKSCGAGKLRKRHKGRAG